MVHQQELSMEGIVVETSSRIPDFLKSRRPSSFLYQSLYRGSLCWGFPLIVQGFITNKVSSVVSL